MLKKLLIKFKETTIAKKLLIILAFLLLYGLLLILLVYCCGSMLQILYSDLSPFEIALKTSFGRPITIIICVFATIALIRLLFTNNSEINTIKSRDERGVNYQKKATFGSSEILTKETDIKRSFKVDSIDNTVTTVYGQLLTSDKGEKIVGYQDELPPDVPEGSRNTMILATMGSGKSFGYVRTEALQALKRHNSVLLTDPSFELFSDISSVGRKMGVDVYCLNVRNPEYSDYWNCLEEVIDPKTGRISGIKLGKFASIYMRNCAAVKKEDFWYKCAENLVATVIGCVAYERENFIQDLYRKLVDEKLKIDDNEDYRKFLERLKSTENYFISFVKAKKEIRKFAKLKGISSEDIEKVLNDIETSANIKYPFTIANVFDKLMDFDNTEAKFDLIPRTNPAYYYFTIYKRESKNETVKTSAVHQTQQCFSVFADPLNRELLSRDGIHLSDINKKQGMYFISTSDTGNKAANVIASLFISFAFYDAQENYDEAQDESRITGEPNKCLPISAILDEFFSLGVLMGDENEFGTFMSDSRKRKIYVSIIIQYYPQLKINYGEEGRHQIQGGCDTLLYMSGNDPETLKFIQDLIGESTVQVTSRKKIRGLFNSVDSNEFTVTDAKRYALSQGEARQWQRGEILVIKQGENPVKIKSFPWIHHPLYKESETVSIKSCYKSLSEIIDEEFDEIDITSQIDEAEKNVKQAIENLQPQQPLKYDETTGEIIENEGVEEEIDDNNDIDDIDFDSNQEIYENIEEELIPAQNFIDELSDISNDFQTVDNTQNNEGEEYVDFDNI